MEISWNFVSPKKWEPCLMHIPGFLFPFGYCQNCKSWRASHFRKHISCIMARNSFQGWRLQYAHTRTAFVLGLYSRFSDLTANHLFFEASIAYQ